jgi:hypothetical protein
MGQIDFTTTETNDKLTGAYGGIHVHANATLQAIPTGATYIKVINFADNDPSAGTTPDATNNKITITKAGVYRVEGAFSMTSGTANVVAFGSLFVDAAEIESIHFSRKISVAGDVGNANFTGLISLTSGQEIDFRVRHDNVGSVNMTFTYMNLNISRVDI